MHCSSQAQGFTVPTLQIPKRGISTWHVGRGGAVAVAATSESSDNDDPSEPIEVDIVSSSFSDLAAENAKQMTNSAMDDNSRVQQSKSYVLASALWSSLALDTVLNKRKRAFIIPGAADVGGKIAMSNIVTTANLLSGFILSAGLAFFLSRDLNRSEVGNWEEELKAEAMRKKLHLLLFFNGLTNLCANINPGAAPFFGIGGFVINSHNALLALNGWIKESSSPSPSSSTRRADADAGMIDFIGTFKSIFASIFKIADVSLGFTARMMSSLYMSCALIAGLRALDIISNSLVPHYSLCLSLKTFAAGPVGQLQLIGLKWAALSRILLAGGACAVLKSEVDDGRLKGRVAKTLAAIISICALISGIPPIVSNSIDNVSSGFKLVVFGLFAGGSSII